VTLEQLFCGFLCKTTSVNNIERRAISPRQVRGF